MLTTVFSAIWALRMRVSMSANGSCILMGLMLLIQKISLQLLYSPIKDQAIRPRLRGAGYSRDRSKTNQAPRRSLIRYHDQRSRRRPRLRDLPAGFHQARYVTAH